MPIEDYWNFRLFVAVQGEEAEHPPIWYLLDSFRYRYYANNAVPESMMCKLLERALKDLNAERMVIGHTVVIY
jgi:hypothetical protein